MPSGLLQWIQQEASVAAMSHRLEEGKTHEELAAVSMVVVRN